MSKLLQVSSSTKYIIYNTYIIVLISISTYITFKFIILFPFISSSYKGFSNINSSFSSNILPTIYKDTSCITLIINISFDTKSIFLPFIKLTNINI